MAHGIIDVSAAEPCPFCGKPDWCGKSPIEGYTGMYMHFCKRSNVEQDVVGSDGRAYVYMGRTRDGSAKYEECEQHRARMLEQNDGWEYAEVSAMYPCPVCGATHGCKTMRHLNGTRFELCENKRDGKNVQIGSRWYIYTKDTKNGKFARYEEREARKKRIRDFKSGETKDVQEQRTFVKVQPVSAQELKVVDKVEVRENTYLDKIYRYLLECLVLDPNHEKYLKSEGWSDELIEKNHIKSFPERDFIRFTMKNNVSKNPYRKTLAKKITDKFGEDSLLGVPGAYKDSKGNWTFAGNKGIFFPCYDVDGNLYRLRIRMDFMDVTEKLTYPEYGDPYYDKDSTRYYVHEMKGIYRKVNGAKEFEKAHGKYRNLSSYYEDKDKRAEGLLVNIYDSGCGSDNQLGVYFNYMADDMFVCFLTEGEKKGIFSNDKMHAPFISFPGVNSWALLLDGEPGERVIDKLKKKGVGMFVVAFDADKSYNEAVLKNEKNVIDAIKKEGFAVGTAEWDGVFGKGIDDLLAGGHQPDFSIA